MKKVFSNLDKNRIEAFTEFAHLWKTDDREWVETRKNEWKIQNGQYDGPDKELLARYYVYGEEPPSYLLSENGRQVSTHCSFGCRLAYVPFTSAEQIQRMWQLGVNFGGYRDRQHAEVRSITHYIDKLDYCCERVEMASVLFSGDYFLIKKENSRTNLTMGPKDFIVSYASLSSFNIKYKHLECGYENFTLPYFLLCLEWYDRNSNSRNHEFVISRISDMYSFLCGLDDSKLNSYRKSLKDDLLGLIDSPDCPKTLLEGWEKANEGEA